VRTPQFGVAFQGNRTPREYAELATLVDRYDFAVVSVYNDLLFQPALGPLLWMAPHLRRPTRIGPAALNPYLVHPLELAGQAALLDLATGGRAYLGLARGAWLDGLGVAQPRPVQRLREAVLLIRHLLAGCPAPFEGEVFQHPANAVLQYPRVREQVPISIGTWGRRTARLAGEVADELKIGGSANPAMASRLRRIVSGGSRTAGRAADAVGVCLGAVTVVDTDRARARALARREVARYIPVVARLDPSSDPDWLAQLDDLATRASHQPAAEQRAPQQPTSAARVERPLEAAVDAALATRSDAALAAQSDAELAVLLPDEVLDRFAFAGTPDDLVRQCEAIFAAGATRVEFGTPLGADPHTAVRLLGERVLPAFRSTMRDAEPDDTTRPR